jgi:hypothetical protein
MPAPTGPDPATIRRAPATAAGWYTGHAGGVGLRPERRRAAPARPVAGQLQVHRLETGAVHPASRRRHLKRNGSHVLQPRHNTRKMGRHELSVP